MKVICPECGNEIPEDSDFCYHCGRSSKDAIKIGDEGNVIQGNNICKRCGSEVKPTDMFCQNCGFPVTQDQVTVLFKPKMVKNGWIGILLALIPGFISIFGLGHLWFRRYKRAVMYIAISIPMVYFSYFADITSYLSTLVFLASIFIYLLQAMEVLMLAYMPGGRNGSKKE